MARGLRNIVKLILGMGSLSEDERPWNPKTKTDVEKVRPE